MFNLIFSMNIFHTSKMHIEQIDLSYFQGVKSGKLPAVLEFITFDMIKADIKTYIYKKNKF